MLKAFKKHDYSTSKSRKRIQQYVEEQIFNQKFCEFLYNYEKYGIRCTGKDLPHKTS